MTESSLKNTMASWPLAVVGPGKVGTAMAARSFQCGWPVVAMGGRNPQRTRDAARNVSETVRAVDPAQAARSGRLIWLTVSDEAIEPLCRQLAEAGAFRNESIVLHCSGVLDSGVLSSARECGCSVAACHPLQTFPSADAGLKRLEGTCFFCEGDANAMVVARSWVETIGGRFCEISGGAQAKANYHTGAVMACNYVTTLLDRAVQLMGQAGIAPETALSAMEPIVRATIDNVFSVGPEAALTGPIVRGDHATVERHLQAMSDPQWRRLYRMLGIATIDLARRKAAIEPAMAEQWIKRMSEQI